MSDFTIELTDPQINILTIETSFIENLNNVTVEVFDSYNLDIVNTEKILVGDLPNNIPMTMIIGNLDVTRIENLDEYLSEIPVDGGSP